MVGMVLMPSLYASCKPSLFSSFTVRREKTSFSCSTISQTMRRAGPQPEQAGCVNTRINSLSAIKSFAMDTFTQIFLGHVGFKAGDGVRALGQIG